MFRISTEIKVVPAIFVCECEIVINIRQNNMLWAERSE